MNDASQAVAAQHALDDALPAQDVLVFVGALSGENRVRGLRRIIESADDARRFGEAKGHLIAEFQLPLPTRTVRIRTLSVRRSEP